MCPSCLFETQGSGALGSAAGILEPPALAMLPWDSEVVFENKVFVQFCVAVWDMTATCFET